MKIEGKVICDNNGNGEIRGKEFLKLAQSMINQREQQQGTDMGIVQWKLEREGEGGNELLN